MSRQIKGDIFSGRNDEQKEDHSLSRFLKENDKSARVETALKGAQPSLEIDFTDFQLLVARVDQVKRDVKEATNNLQSLDSALSSTIDTSDNRFERVKNALIGFDGQIKSSLQEIHSQIAQLSSKINGRKMNEEKIEELVNRHNLVIQNFEHKIALMQKVIGEQESQLTQTRVSLKDAIKYIEKLKKL